MSFLLALRQRGVELWLTGGRAERREGSKVRRSEATRCKKNWGRVMDQGVELKRSSRLQCRRFVLFIILVNGSGGGNGRRNDTAMEDKSRSKFKSKSKSKSKQKNCQRSPVASPLRSCVGIKAKAVGVHQGLVLQQEITEQGRDQRQ